MPLVALVLLGVVAASPAAPAVEGNAEGAAPLDARADAATAAGVVPPEDPGPGVVPVKRRLTDLVQTPAEAWAFAQLGAAVAFEVVRDNPWTFGLVTLAGVGLGVVVGAVLFGAAGAGVAAALYLTGTLVTWPLVFVVLGPLVMGGLCGTKPGLIAGASTGFALSIDEGELSMPF